MSLFFELEFTDITPSCCNVPFAMSKSHYDKRRSDQKNWWCPNCGSRRHFIGRTEEQKKIDSLKADLNSTRRELNMERTDRRDAQKKYTRIRTRVQQGQCPCCDKKFENLRDHMASEHQLTGGEMLRALRETFGLTQQNLEAETGVNQNYISRYENSHDVPEWAEETLNRWMQNKAA
jgi:DNA-binding transcriptional regulator YiaG/DNA-directed RNA polymerase subunit RPC12/RpoP